MKLVFFDLETGGLDSHRHPITQIAAVAVDGSLKEIETFEVKLQFDLDSADAEALAKNSYDAETWEREAVAPDQACDSFSQFLRRHSGVRMVSKRTGKPYFVAQLAGHNADSFDGPFLQAWYRRLDQFLPAAFSVLCTLQRAKWHFVENADQQKPESFSLSSLADHFGIELTDAHDALADVRATVEVYKALRNLSSER